MKDIENINFDLEEEIDDSLEKFNRKEKIRNLLFSSTLAICGSLALIFGLDILDFNLVNLASMAGICVAASGGISFVNYNIEKNGIMSKNEEAEQNIDIVVDGLDKNGIKTEKSQIKEAIAQVDTITQINTRNSSNEIMSKEEKIIKYFYLLDNADKIRVLRQISLSTIKDGKNEYDRSLSLMEDEDLVDMEIPVYKTLKLKKDMK